MDMELHKVTWSYTTPAQMALHQQAEEVLVSSPTIRYISKPMYAYFSSFQVWRTF
jgi:hypothetical protein